MPSSARSWNKTTTGNTLHLRSAGSNQKDGEREGGRRVTGRRRGTEQEQERGKREGAGTREAMAHEPGLKGGIFGKQRGNG